MKLRTSCLILIVLGFIHSTTRAQQNPLYNYLPEKTYMVIRIDPVKLASQIPAEDFRQSFLYKELMKKPDSLVNEILADPSGTGIDLSKGFLVVGSQGNDPAEKNIHVIGSLLDPAKFQSLITKKSPGLEFKTYGTDRVLFMGDDNVLAWNNKVFIFGGTRGSYEYDMESYPVDDTSTAALQKWQAEQEEKKQKQLRNLSFELLTPISGNPLSVNPLFISTFSQPGEIHIWNDDKNNLPGTGIFPMQNILTKLGTFVSGTRTSVISFQNGRIISENRNFPNQEMADLFSKHPPQPAGDELISQLPKGNILGLMNSTYDPVFVKEVFSHPSIREFLDTLKQHLSFDISRIPAAFGNHMMLAVVENNENLEKPGIDLILTAPIADINEFKKMGQVIMQFYDSLRRTDSSSKFMRDFNPVVKFTDKLMVFSLSEKTAAGYLDQTSVQPPPEWVKEYTQHPMMVYVNMHDIMQLAFIKMSERDTSATTQINSFLDHIGDIIVYGGKFELGSMNTTTEFRFRDPNVNAVKQIFGMINKLGDLMIRSTPEVTVEEVTIEQDEDLPPPPPPPNPPRNVIIEKVKEPVKEPVKKKD